MAMAPEAGQNFLSGNKQWLPFTITQATPATLAAVPSGHRGTWGGMRRPGLLPAFLLSAVGKGAGESVKPPLKAKAGRAAGMPGPSWPPDHVLEAQGPTIF